MKVLLVSYYFSPAVAVGVKRPLSLLVHLKNKGHSVHVLAANWKGKKMNGVEYLGGVRVENNKPSSKGSQKNKKRVKLSSYLRSVDKTLFTSFILTSIVHLIKNRKQKPDIIVATYKPMASVVVGIVASLIYRRPLVVEMRDLISIFGRKKKAFLLHSIDKFIDKLCMKFADQIVVVSPSAKQYAEKFYNRSIHLIYNGIDEIEIVKRTNLRESQSDATTIFYSGNLSPERRLDNISEYMKCYTAGRKFKLIVASSQDPTEYGSCPTQTEWLGFIDRKQVYEHQRIADFLLIVEGQGQDSVENIPAKLYEYMGSNTPILADCNPMSDIVKILEATGQGCSICSQERFNMAINKTWLPKESEILRYTRENQNKRYIDLLEGASI